MGVAKEEPFDPGDGGIPPEMWASDVNENGWVKWKLLESTLSEADTNELGTEYQITLPPQLREYLLSPFHCIDQINNGVRLTSLPSLPCDNPLKEIRKEWDTWKPLLQVGYIPVAEMEDGWGPVCFDSKNGTVVWFDHEELFRLDSESTHYTDELVKLRKPLHKDLDEFYSFTFTEAA